MLDAILKQSAVREAVADAGIRTAGDVARSEHAMRRAREGLATIFSKRGPLTVDEHTAVDTYLTLISPELNEEVRQRGNQARKQREAGGEAELAVVTDVRGWAKDLGLPPTTTWSRLKQAIRRRSKLDSKEAECYWTATQTRGGHGHLKEMVRAVHDFYVAHPSVKRSPIKSDVLQIKDADGVVQAVAKLLSEVSLTDIYLDFRLAHPHWRIGERSFRYLRPKELRRMKQRHLDMCGCRCACFRLVHAAQPSPAQPSPVQPSLAYPILHPISSHRIPSHPITGGASR